LLAQRVNVGVSERYLTAGGTVDIDELLKGAKGDFLGKVDGIGLDD
jgi:ATP-dependent RNA helicase DDX24/MAK5